MQSITNCFSSARDMGGSFLSSARDMGGSCLNATPGLLYSAKDSIVSNSVWAFSKVTGGISAGFTDYIFPAVGKVVTFVKDHFGTAQAWYKANPEFLRGAALIAPIAIVTSLALGIFCCRPKAPAVVKEE